MKDSENKCGAEPVTLEAGLDQSERLDMLRELFPEAFAEGKIDWDTTKNTFVEGDNLEVLKLLLKPYYWRVKMIYIDPPYNTGSEIYPHNYADPLDTYLRLTSQKDSAGNLLTSSAESSGRYHSGWLSMMYPRLFLALQLLDDTGVLLVSIDAASSTSRERLASNIVLSRQQQNCHRGGSARWVGRNL